MNSRWSDEKKALVLQLQHEGLSGAEIAAKLGTTRNAVLGILDRLNGKKRKRSTSNKPRKKQDANHQNLVEPWADFTARKQAERAAAKAAKAALNTDQSDPQIPGK